MNYERLEYLSRMGDRDAKIKLRKLNTRSNSRVTHRHFANPYRTTHEKGIINYTGAGVHIFLYGRPTGDGFGEFWAINNFYGKYYFYGTPARMTTFPDHYQGDGIGCSYTSHPSSGLRTGNRILTVKI